MPTVTSWTDALRDTRSLIRFRMATIRKRRRLRVAIAILGYAGDRLVRFAFCKREQVIEEAAARLAQALA